MNRLLRRANKSFSVGGAAMLLVSAALLGQMLGFLRTKLINANYSALGPMSTDTYFAAFKIPDFFYLTLAAGALTVAFMPILADHFEKGDRKGAWDIASSLFNLLAVIMFFVGVVILIFAKPLLHYIVAPGLTPEQLHNSTTIMRLICFNPLLFTLSGILMGVQQTIGRFFFFAIAPLFYNLAIIISIFIFKDNIGIVGLGIGALIGAIIQFLVSLIGMTGMNFKYHMKIKWRQKDFQKVLRQLPPRSLDQGIDSINSIVETNFARRLGEGNISYYENAFTLNNAPIMLIGGTVSTAAFPRLTERLAQGRTDLFRRDFLRVLRILIWLALPVAVLSYFTRGYLARLIFTRDAPEIALVFGFLAGAMFFRIIYLILSRYFYAQKDTITPLVVSIFAIILNFYLAYTLSRPTAYGIAGLALAQSFVAAFEVFILTAAMVIRDRSLFTIDFMNALVKMLSVTGFAVVISFVMISFFPLTIGDTGAVTLGGKLLAISATTLGVYVAMSAIFGLEEAKLVMARLRRIILRPVKVIKF